MIDARVSELLDEVGLTAPSGQVATIVGNDVKVGQPHVAGAKVTAEVLGEVKGEKIKVLKFKAKKRVKRLTGHRQHYSEIKITKIA